MKRKRLIIICFLSIILILAILYYLFYTTPGSRFIAEKVISRFGYYEDSVDQKFNGNLAGGLTLKNLELTDLEGLPEGTILKIQRVFLNVTALSLNGFYAEFENVRLRLPDSDPIVLSGTFKEQQLDLNIHSIGFTVAEVISYLPDLKNLIPLRGEVQDIDLYVTGHYLEPVVKGTFAIDEFIYKGFALENTPLTIDIQLKNVAKDVQLYGTVFLETGNLKTKRVLVKLNKGQLLFSGPWDQPQINFNGESQIRKTFITITLKGTITEPELNLTSEPPYSREKLMVMLATGKSWTGVEDSIDNGLDRAAVTKDFIDYFFFAGKTNRFAQKFGISEFSVEFDKNKKGISATKSITKNLEVGYGIEQTTEEDQTKTRTQKIKGELSITDNLSVDAEHEVSQKEFTDSVNDPVPVDNSKILLKYKKNF